MWKYLKFAPGCKLFVLALFFRTSIHGFVDWLRELSSVAGQFFFVLALSVFFYFCFITLSAVLRGTPTDFETINYFVCTRTLCIKNRRYPFDVWKPSKSFRFSLRLRYSFTHKYVSCTNGLFCSWRQVFYFWFHHRLLSLSEHDRCLIR